MLQFLIKQGYDVSAHEQNFTWSCLAQLTKLWKSAFFPVIHHLAVTIKAKFIPAEWFKNFVWGKNAEFAKCCLTQNW